MTYPLHHKKVLVLGLGETGLSVLRWLRQQGAVLSVADTRKTAPNLDILQAEMLDVPVHLGAYTAAVFDGIDLIVASPGVAIAGPLADALLLAVRERGVPVVGDIELFAQYKAASSKVIAITGSNGKSTVTELVGAMCKAAGLNTVIAGNIGLPILDVLRTEAKTQSADVYVLELSSFQLEATFSLQADVATVLNLSEDHLDRYFGMADYTLTKARVFQGSGMQVLNRQDPASMGMALAGRQSISFGTDLPPTPDDFGLQQTADGLCLMRGSQTLMPVAELRIAGLHNASNALAALALCSALGLAFAPLLAALRAFRGLPHRVEWVTEITGINFYDDSKGTNVGATCAALAGLSSPHMAGGIAQKVVLIAGGDGKGQDFSPLKQPVAQFARAVVLIGRDALQIAAVVAETGVVIKHATSLEQAVNLAFSAAQPGDTVLLSPACASFDMFDNYLHRAQVFVSAVTQLSQAHSADTPQALAQ